MIDKLCDQKMEGDLGVASLYIDYNLQREQSVTNLMGAILKQLVGRPIPRDIRKAFHEGRVPQLEDLMRMLRITIAKLPKVYICIDALDECPPKELPKLLESLRDIVRESPTTKIFLTGRPHIGEAIYRNFTRVVVVPISPKEDDIKDYVVMRLDRDDRPEAMDDSLRAEIMRSILETMSNVYVGASPLSRMYTH